MRYVATHQYHGQKAHQIRMLMANIDHQRRARARERYIYHSDWSNGFISNQLSSCPGICCAQRAFRITSLRQARVHAAACRCCARIAINHIENGEQTPMARRAVVLCASPGGIMNCNLTKNFIISSIYRIPRRWRHRHTININQNTTSEQNCFAGIILVTLLCEHQQNTAMRTRARARHEKHIITLLLPASRTARRARHQRIIRTHHASSRRCIIRIQE